MPQNKKTKDVKSQTSSERLSIAEWFMALLVAALVVIMGMNVVFRYCLSIGIDWADEVSRLIFVWIIFVGAYVAFKRKAHASMSVLDKFIPVPLKRYHKLIVGLLESIFMFVITWFGTIQVLDTARFGQVTAGLGAPMALFYVVIPLTALLITIAILTDNYHNFTNKRGEQ